MPEYDVVVIGGGVSGPAAALYTARAGLDTLVLDRGPSSIEQCAFLENFLGFPAGIDVETFRELVTTQLREAGCDRCEEEAIGVRRTDEGFRVETRQGEASTRRVVAATKYTAAYLEPIADGHLVDRGETRVLDTDVVDHDGRTPIDGVYAAGPLAGAMDQAMASAGHGVRVARAVIADERQEHGYWPAIAEAYFDWAKQDTGEEDLEANVRAWVESTVPDDESIDPDRVERVVRDVLEHERDSIVSDAQIEAKRADAHRVLRNHLGGESVGENAVAAESTDER